MNQGWAKSDDRRWAKSGCQKHQTTPSIASRFLASDSSPSARWDPRGIDLFLQGIASFEFVTGPELDRRQAQWQPLRRYRQAAVHEDAADDVVMHAGVVFMFSHMGLVRDANGN